MSAGILMVDDNPANMLALEAVLQPLGHPCIRAGSGEEALRLVLKNDFGLIIMDAQMPGLDGFQTAELIKQRERTRDIPLIFMSAVHREVDYATRGYAIGAVDYVIKPFEPDFFRAKVSAILEENQRRARLEEQARQLAIQEQQALAERTARQAAETLGRLKDEFIAKLSHELRAPIQVILGWATLLRSGHVAPADVPAALEAIHRNTVLQARLVDDLLDTSRIASGKLTLVREEVDVAEIVSKACQSVAEKAAARGVRLASQLDPCRGFCDAARLHQIVFNLLDNSMKFSDSGGHVEVRLTAEPDAFELRIVDQGVGLDPDSLTHVFDAFWQRRADASPATGGLGLGLSIVRQLVELHGGTVSAESAGPSLGATFLVRMPRWLSSASGVAHGDAALETDPEGRLDGWRILVVDDEADARELMDVILTAKGARVTVAGSGGAAMTELERSEFDVLLSDLSMPGESGFELMARVRARTGRAVQRLPAVAMSAHGDATTRTRALAAGFQEFIAKPFLPGALVAALRKVVPAKSDQGLR